VKSIFIFDQPTGRMVIIFYFGLPHGFFFLG
jgi:hypothetical protein